MKINDLSLAKKLTQEVLRNCKDIERGCAPILDQVTEVTAELLKFWFSHDYCDSRPFNFHIGQKQAILNTIYAHEVLKVTSLKDLYEKINPIGLLEKEDSEFVLLSKNNHPKYCLKMATGTGKTWVLQALLIWQILNAEYSCQDQLFTKNFLLIAPGLIVYERLCEAFLGKEMEGKRNFHLSDLYQYQELFLPDNYKNYILRFIQANVCLKEDIGHKITSNGLIAITNKHALKTEEDSEEFNFDTPGLPEDPKKIIKRLLPLSPGMSAGNDLVDLDRKFEKRGVLQCLSSMTDLMVFNDEAHHIHEIKKTGETTEVEWQKSLNIISQNKKNRFFQIDFSATPYNQIGSGQSTKKSYFPHIIYDFDLKEALTNNLIKSIVLDKRKEIGAIPNNELTFKCDRDEEGNPKLSDGQRTMLRAGLVKLRKLEEEFTQLAPNKLPKMLIVCEDTNVTPLVEEFLKLEGISEKELLRVDSNKKGDVSEEEWKNIREKLFNIDKSSSPKIIISVLMLREGFDVNNICIIVPLRASSAPILLEQTIGRGLRLMWREPDFEENKKENRILIHSNKEPTSLIDVLTIIEHPAFIQFYKELLDEGLVSIIEKPTDGGSTGDLISIGLKDNFQDYDFSIPLISRELEEELKQKPIDIYALEPFDAYSLEHLKTWIGKDDRFYSEDMQTKTTYGDYRVQGGVMTATGYNDFLGRLVARISKLLTEPITKSSKVFANKSQFPFLQVDKAILAHWIHEYIINRLFSTKFDPFLDQNWRILLIDFVINHIIKTWAQALLSFHEEKTHINFEVSHKKLSEVSKLTIRESYSIQVSKCIYEKLRYPSKNGEFEKAFIEAADRDAEVERFCKIDEYKHYFLRLRYINEEGTPSFYHPDFLVKIDDMVYLVETKAQNQLNHCNVERKHRAAHHWCEKINQLPPFQRMNSKWAYVLIGQSFFNAWISKGASIKDILNHATIKLLDVDQSSILSYC